MTTHDYASRQPRRRDRTITHLLTGLISVVAGLVLVELALRAFDVPHFYHAHSMPKQFDFIKADDGTVLYTNTASADIEFIYDGNPRGYFDDHNAVHHTTNSLGFRGAEFHEKERPGSLRIAVLGDSFTFGEGVKDDDTYAQQLERKLRAAAPDKPVDVLNFGVGGYNTEQELLLLKILVLKTSPDALVIGYTLNDAEPKLFSYDAATQAMTRRPREQDVPEGIAEAAPPQTWIYSFGIARLFWQVWHQSRANTGTIDYYNGLYNADNPNWLQTRKSLDAIGAICEQRAIDCYVLVFPVLYDLNDNYPFSGIHAKIAAEVSAMHSSRVTLIDLFPVLKGRNAADLWVHPTDQHPNEVVHGIVAGILAERLVGRLK